MLRIFTALDSQENKQNVWTVRAAKTNNKKNAQTNVVMVVSKLQNLLIPKIG
jgi:hypothetical protein